MKWFQFSVVLLAIITFTGQALAITSELQAEDDGLFLLKALCDKESKVDLLMLVKTAPPEIGIYTKKISALAHDTLDLIASIQKESPSVNLDKNPLPALEIAVRDSIQGDKQHQLLFGTSGPEFARALVVTQIEACMYAKHLTLVLAQNVKSESQQKSLLKISAKWGRLGEQGFVLLGSGATK